jgi:hypothetical protein
MTIKIDGFVKKIFEVPRWLWKKVDIRGVVFWQLLDHTCSMSRSRQKTTTKEIGLFTTPSKLFFGVEHQGDRTVVDQLHFHGGLEDAGGNPDLSVLYFFNKLLIERFGYFRGGC